MTSLRSDKATKPVSNSATSSPLRSALPALVAAFLTAIPLVLARRSVSYRLPDYGDLWRWALNLHFDESLTSQELFSETNLIGHNHVLTIWLSSKAASGSNYSLLWWAGCIGVILSAGAVAYVTHQALSDVPLPRWVGAAASILVALLAFRFDEGISYFNSLLVFEQLFYFFSLAALLIGAWLQAQQLLETSIPARQYKLQYGLLGVMLFMGEAPAALSLVVLMGMAVLGVLVFRQWGHLVGVLAAAGLGIVVKWLLRSLAGGRGVANGPDSTFGFLDPSAIPDWIELTGSSIFSFVGDRSQPAPAGVYQLIGVLILVVVLGAIIGMAIGVRRNTISHATLHLALSGVMLVSFSIVAAMFIIDARADALNGRYDVGRFVRSTQFTMAGVALIGLAGAMHGATLRILRQVSIGALIVVVFIARVPSALDVQDVAVFVARATESRDVAICEPPPESIEWRTYWASASDGLVDQFEGSALFDQWRTEGCLQD